MLLAVEISNSVLNFGLFDTNRTDDMIKSFKIATDLNKTFDEYSVVISGIFQHYGIAKESVDGAIVCSVVPQLTDVIVSVIKSLCGVCAMTVGKGTRSGFPIRVDNPSELGTDLVSNAAAAINIMKKEENKLSPAIIVDLGTATTVFALNSKGEYIGGCIYPGIGISFEALHGKTAQLPSVSPENPTRAIGKNSQESLRSGIILGNAIIVDGFIERFAREMNCGEDFKVFLTGEYAHMITAFLTHDFKHIPELTLMGLLYLYKNNI